MSAVFPEPFFRFFYIVINACADIPEGLAVIGFYHVSAFMGSDVIQHEWRSGDEAPTITNMALPFAGYTTAPAGASIAHADFANTLI